jgi:hypothetical protein
MVSEDNNRDDINQAVYDVVMGAYHRGEEGPGVLELVGLMERRFEVGGYIALLAVREGCTRAGTEIMADAAKTKAFLNSEVGQTMQAIPGMTTAEAMRLHGYWKDAK